MIDDSEMQDWQVTEKRFGVEDAMSAPRCFNSIENLYICISHSQMFFKIGVLKNFANCTEKHLRRSLFSIKLQAWSLQFYLKETPAKVFSCEICNLFKIALCYKTRPVASSALAQLYNWCFLNSFMTEAVII